MILLKPQADNEFTCIPREYVTTAVMILRDDSTNVKVKYALEPRVEGVGNILIDKDSYVIYNNVYENLVEGHFYDITLYSNYEEGIVMFKDRAFCTAQKNDIQKANNFYKINKDQYTEYNGFNNDYIVI
jgi:hypothetical protein